ncbi:MAG TPA: MOSC N-terminal beta barrel domain-containing protein [Gaiellaceae bacterium]|nr:MOSC N-terminal beta barrel domain-containing protein [Gaiellaceae bacterium]
MSAARVVRISLAPVKGLALVHPDEVELGPGGVVGDRRFWLQDAEGRLVNGKTHGDLMRVRAEWDEGTRRLALSFPDGEMVVGAVEPGALVEATLWKQPHASRSVPGPWQEALSRYAGEALTFLWSESGAVDRGVDRGAATLVSRGSLERLRDEAGAEAPVDGRRFRMLFEADGVPAHGEDEWIGSQVRVGEAVLAVAGDVGRCVVTTRDPDTGVSDLDTLGALAGYRREGRTEPLPFGVHGAVAVPGRVRVGDPVAPLDRGTARS